MASNRINKLCLVILLFIWPLAEVQQLESFVVKDPCVAKTTCKECIQINSCAWCMQQNFGDKPRCFQPSSDVTVDACDEVFTWNPKNVQSTINDWPLTEVRYPSTSSGPSHDIIQIRPQRINLQMRMNQPYRLDVKYSQVEEFHLDLYFLMDSSKCMKDEKENLNKLAETLAAAIPSLTNNFKLGVGSFLNEILVPNSSTNSGNELCENCTASYGYKNLMALSNDFIKFYETVKNAPLSENLDAPKRGLDAMLQALECREKIGWTQNAKKILIYLTASDFESAEDGKLGRSDTPNDGRCHLDDTGTYTRAAVQNYPNISQINQKVRENFINIIFAVPPRQVELYYDLSKHIEGSSVGILSTDSSNVIELISANYNQITASVEMKDNASSSVEIAYFSSCLRKGEEKRETNKCEGLKIGDVVTFTPEIVVTSCPENPEDWHETIEIYPVGINESVIVELEMLCECQCETASSLFYEESSAQCNYYGTYKCGNCECNEGFYGKFCQCDMSGIIKYSNQRCRKDNTTTRFCSGRGTCVCGSCECDQRENPGELISGKFCECDNFSCDRHNQLLCSGPDHGTCECGACECRPGWSGSACDCRATKETCIPPGGEEICSGHGECECGSCKCKVTAEGRYSGKYCEKCPTCSGRCDELKDCVQCQMYKTGPLADEHLCSTNCTSFLAIGVETLNCDEEKEAKFCTFYDKDDCKYNFCYSEKEITLLVFASQERECPPNNEKHKIK